MTPWPLMRSVAGLGITTGLVDWFQNKSITLFSLGMAIISLIIFQWWRDVRREGTFQGRHTSIVESGLRIGMILFIVSEVIFFSSFFWAFFHRRLSPNVELGAQWPPIGVQAFNPFRVPLLNTIILLSSGVRVTWCHHSIMVGDMGERKSSLALTILLGGYFTLIQLFEYIEAPFSMTDSTYGRTFFIATGFHGFHVIVGTLFLLATYVRMTNCRFSKSHHFGFEASAWYWHFVDVVWLFLFIAIYWWGGKAA